MPSPSTPAPPAGFPSPLERGAILRALSRGVTLAPDVDLSLVGGGRGCARGMQESRVGPQLRPSALLTRLRPPWPLAMIPSLVMRARPNNTRQIEPDNCAPWHRPPCCPTAQVGYNAEFYSGADLAALLAEAQLAAVHEALEAEEAEQAAAGAAAPPAEQAGEAGGGSLTRRPHTHPAPGSRAAPRPPVIQPRHLEAALAAARPSVPEAERERLEAIYAQFRQDRQPGQATAADKGKGKLVSWA